MSETTGNVVIGIDTAYKKPVIYLSGPMTGIAEYNYPAFEAYAKKWRLRGFKVFSPHELDRKDGSDKDLRPWDWYLRRDLQLLIDPENGITHVYLMPGWQKSKGAQLEANTATALGIKLFDAESGLSIVDPNVLHKADELTSRDRQAVYGHPLEDFSRTAALWNAQFSNLLAPGKSFDAEDVPMAMIHVKMSRLANGYHEDSMIDVPGYIRTRQMVRQKRQALKDGVA